MKSIQLALKEGQIYSMTNVLICWRVYANFCICFKFLHLSIILNIQLQQLLHTQAKSLRENFTWNKFHVNFTWNFHVNFTWISSKICFMWISRETVIFHVNCRWIEFHMKFTWNMHNFTLILWVEIYSRVSISGKKIAH